MPQSLDNLVLRLRAVSEPSRLRLLALCSQGEWTVSELTQAMNQSQPRISRHLKILAEAGLVERFREGSWVFYRRTQDGEGGRLARSLGRMLPLQDRELVGDRRRLDAVRHLRSEQAAVHFDNVASDWDQIRQLHSDDAAVEAALLGLFSEHPPQRLLDIGTGTGRILELLAPFIGTGLGIDLSRDMLTIARDRLDRLQSRNCTVRHGDMYDLPLGQDQFDAAILHQVLHFADNPAAVLLEVSRILKPGGRLIIIDYAPHDLEHLRSDQAHRRLGFSEDEIRLLTQQAGFEVKSSQPLPGEVLTVVIWDMIRSENAERSHIDLAIEGTDQK